jgi:hypothetical protein
MALLKMLVYRAVMPETLTRGRNGIIRLSLLALLLLTLSGGSYAAGTWTPLTNSAPCPAGYGVSLMLQGTDGRILAQCYDGQTWMALKPDIHGSYLNGTWTTLAPAPVAKLYFANQILSNGNLVISGGEYSGAGLPAAWSGSGYVYNPFTNTWAAIANYPNQAACASVNGTNNCLGDEPSMLLTSACGAGVVGAAAVAQPQCQMLVGNLVGATQYIYSYPANTWTATGAKIYENTDDEEGWTKLADGRVLNYDKYKSIVTNGSYAEAYNPATGLWQSISPSDGTANGFIPQLSNDNTVDYEDGPIMRLQDGRTFFIGANQNTAFYNLATNTWSAGPQIMGTLGIYGADDAGAGETAEGDVIFAADSGIRDGKPYQPPTDIFDFNPATNTITDITSTIPDPYLPFIPSFVTHFLAIPSGQLLFADGVTGLLYAYTPAGSPSVAVRPVVSSFTYTGTPGVFTLTGSQLNGQSAGGDYGDDDQLDSNYPIVRLQATNGNVYYCTTSNWSSTGVNTGAGQTVTVTLNPAITAGTYILTVSGAGIPGIPIVVNITAAEI